MAKTDTAENQNTLLMVLIISVLVLAVGQYLLYRNIQHVKNMIGVTTMELKEGKGIRQDAVMMIGDSMMIRENGIEGEMTEDVVLEDGSKVMTDGTIVKPDGKSSKMKDGEEMMMDGTMIQK